MSKMHSVVSVALLAAMLGVGLPGCGGGSSTGSGNLITNIPNADGRSVPPQLNLPSLKLSVSTDKTTYATGETIHITISVTNSDTKSHTVQFTTGSKTDWWGYIVAQNGKIVTYEYWTGHHLVFPANIGVDTYAPGETQTFPYDFPFVPSPDSLPLVSTLPPGTYQIYARYPDGLYDGGSLVSSTVPTPVSAPVTVTVTP